LLAYTDPVYASECGRYFRRLGWEVQLVASGAEARVLAHQFHPDVVALDAAKISTENPSLSIILVAGPTTDCTTDRLHMVGAEQFVRRADGAEALAHAVLGPTALSAVV
jgi:hypothetical protein